MRALRCSRLEKIDDDARVLQICGQDVSASLL